jgi:hypothetical protein
MTYIYAQKGLPLNDLVGHPILGLMLVGPWTRYIFAPLCCRLELIKESYSSHAIYAQPL